MVTREVAARKSKKDAFLKEIERATKTAGRVITVCNAGATALTTGFIWQARTADGTSFSDVCIAGLVGGVLFFALQKLHRYGLHLIPHMDADNKQRSMGVWACLVGGAALISSTTSILFLAGPKADAAHIERTVTEVTQDSSNIIQAMRSAEGLAPLIESSQSTALVMADGEMREGTVCQNGGGRGECHNVLTAIAETSSKSATDILDARSRAVPLIELIDDEMDKLTRTQQDGGISSRKKSHEIQRSITIISNAASQLASNIPIAAIENAAAAYARETRTMRINEVGAARIRAAFSDTASRLRMKLPDLRAAQNQRIRGYSDIKPWNAIGQELETVWTLCLIALLLDALPLGLCIIMLSVDRHRENLVSESSEELPTPQAGQRKVLKPVVKSIGETTRTPR